MIFSSKTAVAAAVMAGLLASAAIAQDVAAPRIVERRARVQAIDPPPQFRALGVGKPVKLAMLDAWMTSDLLPDEFSTDAIWFDNEFLSLLAFFYTPSSRNIRGILEVRNESGVTVINDVFEVLHDPDAIQGVILDLGVLPVGAYRVSVKFKQGKKSVGQQFWIFVDPPPAQ